MIRQLDKAGLGGIWQRSDVFKELVSFHLCAVPSAVSAAFISKIPSWWQKGCSSSKLHISTPMVSGSRDVFLSSVSQQKSSGSISMEPIPNELLGPEEWQGHIGLGLYTLNKPQWLRLIKVSPKAGSAVGPIKSLMAAT